MRTCFQPYRHWCAVARRETAAIASGRASLEKKLLAYDRVGPLFPVDHKDVVDLGRAHFIATLLYLAGIFFVRKEVSGRMNFDVNEIREIIMWILDWSVRGA